MRPARSTAYPAVARPWHFHEPKALNRPYGPFGFPNCAFGDISQTDGNTFQNQLPVFFKEDLQHGLPSNSLTNSRVAAAPKVLTDRTLPSASTMKYMTGLCSNTSLHCASLARRASVACCTAVVRYRVRLPFACGYSRPGAYMINAARNKAMSSTTAIKWSATSGAGPARPDASCRSHASAMPPRNDCSADRQDFSFSLRMAALSVRLSGPALGS